MLPTVSKHQVAGVQCHIVPRYLVENLLADGYSGGFAFYDDLRFHPPVEHDQIGTPAHTVYRKFLFHPHQWQGILLYPRQEVNHMLANPFLGCKTDIPPPGDIPNIPFIFLIFESETKSGKM